jgi:ABC-type transport system substrate-binding protein
MRLFFPKIKANRKFLIRLIGSSLFSSIALIGSVGYNASLAQSKPNESKAGEVKPAESKTAEPKADAKKAAETKSAEKPKGPVVVANGRFDSKLSEKVVRYAFPVAETGFDPAQISDLYSRTVVAGIVESLFTWDFLAAPAQMVPNVAESLGEISSDFKTFTVKVKKGIYFAEHPAFGGKKRELTAEDFVYSLKRHYDPKLKSYAINTLQSNNILGLNELRTAAIKNKTPFPYDTPVEGVKSLDRYTIQFKTRDPVPRFLESFSDPSLFGAMAREVVEKYGDKIMENPVGTGPYRLTAWRRASKIVLERNPDYREVLFDAKPAADDVVGQEILARSKGKRVPFNDRIEISILNEEQPRWLAYLNAEHDFLQGIPGSFSPVAIPNNELAPNLKKAGIKLLRTPLSDVTMSFFNMENPIVGGYTPDKVALRRAIALAIDVDAEIRLVRRGQAIPANILQPPGTTGFDASFRSEMSEFSRPKAMALLDMFGYVDKNGDGWRDLPDGSPLILRCLSQSDQASRQLDELFKKNINAIGLKIEFEPAKWPDNLKKARAGNLQMWRLGFSATAPDPDTFVMQGYGPAKGENNLSRFDRPEYDALYNKQKMLPDGPERNAVIMDAHRMLIAYMPYKIHTHRIAPDLMHPWTYNYKRHPFMRDIYKYLEVDTAARVKALGEQ